MHSARCGTVTVPPSYLKHCCHERLIERLASGAHSSTKPALLNVLSDKEERLSAGAGIVAVATAAVAVAFDALTLGDMSLKRKQEGKKMANVRINTEGSPSR